MMNQIYVFLEHIDVRSALTAEISLSQKNIHEQNYS